MEKKNGTKMYMWIGKCPKLLAVMQILKIIRNLNLN